MTPIKSDKSGTPEHESFYFGIYTCAYCLDSKRIKNGDRKRMSIPDPIYGDQAETEIIIPSGVQSFHRECLAKLKKEQP